MNDDLKKQEIYKWMEKLEKINNVKSKKGYTYFHNLGRKFHITSFDCENIIASYIGDLSLNKTEILDVLEIFKKYKPKVIDRKKPYSNRNWKIDNNTNKPFLNEINKYLTLKELATILKFTGHIKKEIVDFTNNKFYENDRYYDKKWYQNFSNIINDIDLSYDYLQQKYAITRDKITKYKKLIKYLCNYFLENNIQKDEIDVYSLSKVDLFWDILKGQRIFKSEEEY